jgi:hypothetical protein
MRMAMDDGVGLEVECRGDGPPVLLVHGFGGAPTMSRASPSTRRW